MLNTYDRLLGWADSPLTPAGAETARYLVTGLKMIDAINQSDDKQEAEDTFRVETRMQRTLTAMLQDALKEGDSNILAVSSGLLMQVMISDVIDKPNKNKPLINAAVIKITYKNSKYRVTDVCDMSYVSKGKEALSKK